MTVEKWLDSDPLDLKLADEEHRQGLEYGGDRNHCRECQIAYDRDMKTEISKEWVVGLTQLYELPQQTIILDRYRHRRQLIGNSWVSLYSQHAYPISHSEMRRLLPGRIVS